MRGLLRCFAGGSREARVCLCGVRVLAIAIRNRICHMTREGIIKKFLGKPIISYSITTAINSGLFDRVIVSTDNNSIAEIANEYGAETPFLRITKL